MHTLQKRLPNERDETKYCNLNGLLSFVVLCVVLKAPSPMKQHETTHISLCLITFISKPLTMFDRLQ